MDERVQKIIRKPLFSRLFSKDDESDTTFDVNAWNNKFIEGNPLSAAAKNQYLSDLYYKGLDESLYNVGPIA